MDKFSGCCGDVVGFKGGRRFTSDEIDDLLSVTKNLSYFVERSPCKCDVVEDKPCLRCHLLNDVKGINYFF